MAALLPPESGRSDKAWSLGFPPWARLDVPGLLFNLKCIFHLLDFCWSVVDLQRAASFCYSKVSQACICVCLLLVKLFSYVGHYRILTRVSCDTQQVLVDYLSCIQHCGFVGPSLPIYPFSLGNDKFNSYLCDSIFVLYIGSFIPCFLSLRKLCDIWYFFLCQLTSLDMTTSGSVCACVHS